MPHYFQPALTRYACTLLSANHRELYVVHKQALALDRSQVMVVRAVQGAFCARANVSKVGVCNTDAETVVSVAREPLLEMEEYHQVREEVDRGRLACVGGENCMSLHSSA